MRLHGEKKSVSQEHWINNVTKPDSYFLPGDIPAGTLQESILRKPSFLGANCDEADTFNLGFLALQKNHRE